MYFIRLVVVFGFRFPGLFFPKPQRSQFVFPYLRSFCCFSELFTMHAGYINAARSNYIIKNLTLTIGMQHAVLVIVIEYLPDLVFGQLLS